MGLVARSLAVVGALVVVAALGQGAAPVAAAADASWAPRPDANVKDWYQRRGNAARSGVSSFQPLRSEPQEAWSVDLPGPLCGNVVTWDGIVYVAVSSSGGTDLRAYSAVDGSPQGSRRLASDGDAELAVWNGTVIAQTKDVLLSMAHKRGAFRLPIKWEGSFSGSPLVHDGELYAIKGRGLRRISIGERGDGSRVGDCHGWPSFQIVNGSAKLVHGHVGPQQGYRGEFLHFPGRYSDPVGVVSRRDLSESPLLSLHRLDDGAKRGWLVISRYAVEASDGQVIGVLFPDRDSGFYAYSIVSEVVVRGGVAIGWNQNGELQEIAMDGRLTLMKPGNEPQGFSGRALSAAHDVLYVGNAAVEMGSGRVLWCLDGVHPTTPIIPSGDGRIVVGAAGNRLVGFVEKDDGGAAVRSATATLSRLAAPSDADGVLLADGRHVLGKVTVLPDGGLTVTPNDGAAQSFTREQIAVATAAGKRVGPHDEFLAYRAWRNALRVEISDAYAEFALRCIRERMLDFARGVLERARAYGLPEDEFAQVGSRITGLSENPSAAARTPRLQETQRELEAEFEPRVMAGVDWLEQRGLKTAAAALLAEVVPFTSTRAWVVRGLALAPDEFPLKSKRGGGEAWPRWARALLPSGGRFVAANSPEFARFSGAPWNEGSMQLATANLRLLTRSDDPELVGGCLQRGETAIRALETMLLDAPPKKRGDPLMVLLHRNNKEYLAERTPTGGAAAWSAGYYSPMEQVSRFYAPGDEGARDPLGRGLYSTLAHELTHHWVDARWAGGRTSTALTPGYWVVEGLAQFVGDQAADSDPYTVRLDDPRAPSLDAMAQAGAAGKSLPLTDFIDLPQLGFAALDDTPVVTVQLRNTLERRRLDLRALFYEQSAALTWFMMNRRGDEGREALKRYLWAYYSGNTPKGGWKSLGFATREELVDSFTAFLAEVAGKRVTLQAGSSIRGGPALPEVGATGGGPRRAPTRGPGTRDGPPTPPPTGPAPAGTTYQVGAKVWVMHKGEDRTGSVTGVIDGKYWVTFKVGSQTLRALVPGSRLKPRPE